MANVTASAEITYVQFIAPVSIGGDMGSIEAWSKQRTPKIKLDMAQGWVTLRWDNQVRRIPMANVAYIAETIA